MAFGLPDDLADLIEIAIDPTTFEGNFQRYPNPSFLSLHWWA